MLFVIMIEGKTKSDMTNRELHNVFRFMQPLEAKRHDLHRDTDKTLVTTRSQQALLDIDPQVNGKSPFPRSYSRILNLKVSCQTTHT